MVFILKMYHNPGVIQPLEDGWYDTGDIVSVDKDNFIFIRETKESKLITTDAIEVSLPESEENK